VLMQALSCKIFKKALTMPLLQMSSGNSLNWGLL